MKISIFRLDDGDRNLLHEVPLMEDGAAMHAAKDWAEENGFQVVEVGTAVDIDEEGYATCSDDDDHLFVYVMPPDHPYEYIIIDPDSGKMVGPLLESSFERVEQMMDEMGAEITSYAEFCDGSRVVKVKGLQP